MATEDLHQYVTDDLKMRILFLEKETEHHMHKEDWKLIGKLIEV